MEISICKCGCSQTFPTFDDKNRERKFINGHNTRLKNPNFREKIKQVCKICSKIYYRCPSLANRGKNTYCSNECRSLDAHEWFGGEKNINWKGGINGVQNLRWCPEYYTWRMQVFERDC